MTAPSESGVFTGVIALDGPSGTGKSTVARTLAQRLDARYLDTGAMYRAATAMVLRAGVDPNDDDAVVRLLQDLRVDIGTDPQVERVSVDGLDLSAEIRGPAVTVAVSAVSAVPQVRQLLVAQQRRLIEPGGIVVEGRDIASVVWPQADPKVYLTASAQVRAQRRAAELGGTATVADVQADLNRRDRLDSSRAVSPLMRADGAIELDTSALDIDGVVAALLGLVTAAH